MDSVWNKNSGPLPSTTDVFLVCDSGRVQIHFDVITSNISFIRGANTQERDVTAGPEKREKVCGASSKRSQAIGYRATRTRIQATD